MTTIKLRRGTAAEWTSANPILDLGEFGFEYDTTKFKVGNGTHHWTNLEYILPSSDVIDLINAATDPLEVALDGHIQAGNPHPQYLQDAVVPQNEAPTDTGLVWFDLDATTFRAASEFHAAAHATGGNDPMVIPQSQVTNLIADLNTKAPSNTPVFTGLPLSPTPAAGLNNTQIATTAWAAERAVIGNLLSVNQASGSDVLGNTTGFDEWGYGVAQYASVLGGSHGSARAIEVTKDSGIDGFIPLTSARPIISTSPITVTASVYLDGYSGPCACAALFLDTNGNIVGSYIWNTSFSVLASVWTELPQLTILPSSIPSGATQIRVGASLPHNPGLGAKARIDRLGAWHGVGGTWSLPGTPIIGLGIRVSRPNIDDYLCEQWSHSENKWVRTRYDSGWRDVSATLSTNVEGPGGAITSLIVMRRVNDTVTIETYLHATNLFSPGDFILPCYDGFKFRPSYLNRTYTDVQCYADTSGIRAYLAGPFDYLANLTLLTNDPIPTALPGVLVSAAPA